MSLLQTPSAKCFPFNVWTIPWYSELCHFYGVVFILRSVFAFKCENLKFSYERDVILGLSNEKDVKMLTTFSYETWEITKISFPFCTGFNLNFVPSRFTWEFPPCNYTKHRQSNPAACHRILHTFSTVKWLLLPNILPRNTHTHTFTESAIIATYPIRLHVGTWYVQITL